MDSGEKKKMNELVKIRREIHSNPELSFEEKSTTSLIFRYLERLKPDFLHKFDVSGLIVGFYSEQEGKNLLIRTDIDAVKVQENTNVSYQSKNDGISHACGHDGHIAIMLGMANKLSERNFKGRIFLLFQPAEESGEGAKYVLETSVLDSLCIDSCFSYHNLPGYKKGDLIVSPKLFCATSTALVLRYKGLHSHASEPEKGLSPASATATTILNLEKIPTKLEAIGFTQALVIYTNLGSKDFGLCPENSEIGVTLRAYRLSDLDLLKNKIIDNCKMIAEWYKLRFSFEERDFFPPVLIDNELYENYIKVLENQNFSYEIIDRPFTWSEDFGYFSQKYKSFFIGLGIGENQSNLHSCNYDFPDDCIVDFAEKLYTLICEFNHSY